MPGTSCRSPLSNARSCLVVALVLIEIVRDPNEQVGQWVRFRIDDVCGPSDVNDVHRRSDLLEDVEVLAELCRRLIRDAEASHRRDFASDDARRQDVSDVRLEQVQRASGYRGVNFSGDSKSTPLFRDIEHAGRSSRPGLSMYRRWQFCPRQSAGPDPCACARGTVPPALCRPRIRKGIVARPVSIVRPAAPAPSTVRRAPA